MHRGRTSSESARHPAGIIVQQLEHSIANLQSRETCSKLSKNALRTIRTYMLFAYSYSD